MGGVGCGIVVSNISARKTSENLLFSSSAFNLPLATKLSVTSQSTHFSESVVHHVGSSSFSMEWPGIPRHAID